MPKCCVRKIQRPVKKVTFAPVLVTVPEEEEEEKEEVPVIENKPCLLDRTVVDISERPFREDIGVPLPCVETVRTLHSIPGALRLPQRCCTVTCLYSTFIVTLCVLFLYLSIWLLCIFVFRVVSI
jgi:hypothetical protein